MPDQAFYQLVFRHIIFTQNTAVAGSLQPGQFGADTQGVYITQAGMTPVETQALFSIATDYAKAIAPIDSQAKAIIQRDRNRYPGGRIPAGQKPPEVPSELLALQAEHDTVLNVYIARLQSTVGKDRFTAINTTLRSILIPTYHGGVRPNPIGLTSRPLLSLGGVQ